MLFDMAAMLREMLYPFPFPLPFTSVFGPDDHFWFVDIVASDLHNHTSILEISFAKSSTKHHLNAATIPTTKALENYLNRWKYLYNILYSSGYGGERG